MATSFCASSLDLRIGQRESILLATLEALSIHNDLLYVLYSLRSSCTGKQDCSAKIWPRDLFTEMASQIILIWSTHAFLVNRGKVPTL